MKTPFMDLVEQTVPNAETRVITGCGHFPMFEATADVNDELRAFATRVAHRRTT
jgi:pimeloyl-ACP methyl ester carboxylesterase